MNVKDLFRRTGHKLLSSNSLITTFLRSSISSQLASWTDMLIRFLFFTFVFKELDSFYRSNLSVAVGAIIGGVVNCCINYRFTFQATGQNVKAVAVKYFMVWIGSLLLNMYGTTFGAHALSKWEFLHHLGFTENGIFAAATLAVSLIVSLAWNFVLQRNFVYRPNRFDPYAIRFVNLFTGKKGSDNYDHRINQL